MSESPLFEPSDDFVREQSQRVSVEARIEWLETMLRFAQQTGALQKAHERHREQNDGGPWDQPKSEG